MYLQAVPVSEGIGEPVTQVMPTAGTQPALEDTHHPIRLEDLEIGQSCPHSRRLWAELRKP